MFKNRALTVQMVNTNKNQPTTSTYTQEKRTKIYDTNNIVKEQVRNTAMYVGGGVALYKVLNIAGEIAVIAAKSKFK